MYTSANLQTPMKVSSLSLLFEVMTYETYLTPEFKMPSYGFLSNENLFNFWPDVTTPNQVLHIAHDVHPFLST